MKPLQPDLLRQHSQPRAAAGRRASMRVAALALLLLACFTAAPVFAQFVPGQGFGGFGGGNNAARSRSSRQYPNNQVGDAVISIDPETRNLVVIADEATSTYISQVISNLDRPKPQVLIKVVFLEVTHNDSLDLGVEGSYNKDLGIGKTFTTGFTTNFGVVNNAIVPTSITPITSSSSFLGSNIFGLTPLGAGSSAGLYQLFAQDYTVTLRAIAQNGKARVLSRPSVVARNNQPATITVGQSVPLITDVRFDTFGNAINSVTYQSVGIILRVTPFITSDGMVEMILSPETSELVADRSQWVPISAGVSAPLINSRSADTVVVTPDGQTVIIGGLMANSKADTVTKIPFLGDIPLLGNLFRHTVKSTLNTELIIFLTPHIMMAPTEMATLSAAERAKSDATKSLTEKELNTFLEELPQAPMTNAPPVMKKKK